VRLLLSTSLGAGLLPKAPGTAGTVPPALLHAALALLLPPTRLVPLLAALFLASCAASLALAPWACRRFRSDDPPNFTADEAAGYFLLALFLPAGASPAGGAAACFLLFRLFDVVKLPPARQADRMGGTWGILLDDLAAALQGAAVLHLLLHFFPRLLG
jgi:phosphatidylglycerophosphatase A